MALTTLTSLGSLVLQGLGTFMQYEATEEAQRSADFFNMAELGLKTKSLASQIQESREKLSMDKREAAKKWKWMEEDRGYTRAQKFMENFNSVLDKEPAFKNSLVNIWQRKST